MARKLAGVVFAVSTLHISVAHALGLGDIELKSSINQPLKAEIAVLNAGDIQSGQLSVKLADEKTFAAASVERVFFLSDLSFAVAFDGKGGGTITIASEKLVREPYLDFVLEARWPDGNLVREYTLLVDLPEFIGGAVSEGQASAAPRTAGRIPGPAPTASAVSAGRSRPAAAGVPADGELVTRRNDTLWEIVAKIKPVGVNMQQAMIAMLQRNPDAFDNGNINSLRKGQVLRFPNDGEYRALSPQQAINAVAQHNAIWRADRTTPAGGTEVAVTMSGAPVALVDESYMTLSGTAQAAPAAADSDGASAPGSVAQPGAGVAALQSKITVAEERLDQAERANVEMSSRIGELEQQIETLVKLVELRDQRLADIQSDRASVAQSETPAMTDLAAVGGASGAADAQPSQVDQNFATHPADAPVEPVVADAAQAEQASAAPAALPTQTADSTLAPWLWSAFAAVGAVLGGGGLLLARRRRHEAAAALAAEESVINEEARASLRARAVDATAEAGSVVDAEALLADDDNSEPLFAPSSSPAAAVADADPGYQAECYSNDGRHDEAIALLQQAIAAEPGRSDLQLQLLGILAEQGREQAFKTAFDALQCSDQDTAMMARHLVADKGWLDDVDVDGEAMAVDVDVDGEAMAVSVAADAGEVSPAAGQDFDLDLDLDLDGSVSDLSGSEALELDLNLDAELNTETLQIDPSSLDEAHADAVLGVDLELPEPQSLDSSVDLGLDLDLDRLGKDDDQQAIDALLGVDDALENEMQGLLDGDAISTKLDLAKAYVDMGDADGARDILQEVLQEGSDGQRDEANQLLDALAS